VVCGNDETLMQKAIEYRKWVGHMLSADDAYRLGTQMKTFRLRFERQCSNALELAELLEKHPAVEKVLYPGLKSHSSHTIALKLFKEDAFGGMLTFDLAGKSNEAKKKNRDTFMNIVSKQIHLIPSLGDTETILLPVEPVWGEKYPLPGMIRLSVGIEEPSELLQLLMGSLDELVE
jgi:cystathionine beta-lyase/cystathionine gamma-synthase